MANKKKKATRRGNNEGSVFLNDKGQWVGSVSLGYGPNGKRIRKVFYGKSKSEVTVKMTEATISKLKGGHASVVNDDLQVIITEWLTTFKRAEVSARTYERTVEIAKKHIFTELGSLKLEEITSTTIQGFLNRKLFKGYALATVRKMKFLLNQFFDYAKRCGFVTENPVTDCRVKKTAEHKAITEEKYKAIPEGVRGKFLEVIRKSEILYPICMVQLYAGLRIGETLALKWKDLRFDLNIIRIDNAITVIPEFSNGKVVSRKTVISDTKTAASVREVPMSPTLKECLLEWKKTRWALQLSTGRSFIADNDLVFSTNQGEIRTYGGTKHMFDKLMRQNGLGEYHFHFHTLRHTFSTMLWEMQENPKVIQMLLGHKEVTTTIQIYNSVDRSYFAQATAKIEEKLNK